MTNIFEMKSIKKDISLKQFRLDCNGAIASLPATGFVFIKDEVVEVF